MARDIAAAYPPTSTGMRGTCRTHLVAVGAIAGFICTTDKRGALDNRRGTLYVHDLFLARLSAGIAIGLMETAQAFAERGG